MKVDDPNIRIHIPETCSKEILTILKDDDIEMTQVPNDLVLKDGMLYFNITISAISLASTCLQIYNSLQEIKLKSGIKQKTVIEVLEDKVEIDPDKPWKLIDTKLDVLLNKLSKYKQP